MKYMKRKTKIPQDLIIDYNEKKYSFSTRSLVLYPLSIISLSVLMILFFELRINYWLHELISKQTVFLLNLFFNMNAEAVYLPEFPYPWHISVDGTIIVYIISGCAGTPAISILTSIIISTPHSQDANTNEDMVWRKTKASIATIISIYGFNIFRMVIIQYLYHLGFAWDLIHNSFANLSAVIIVHIFIFWFCNKYIPEWYIAMYYFGKLLNSKIRSKIRGYSHK